MESYCYDLSYLADLLVKFTGTYSVLVGAADSLNRITLARKDDVEDAIDRAEDLGKIIDKITNILETQVVSYINYIKGKNDYISGNYQLYDIVQSEMNHNIIVAAAAQETGAQ
jgi:hypothetical protein